MNIAVVICLDKNKIVIKDEKIEHQNYETEAILCCSSWRCNAGKLKNVPIYAVCNCINSIKQQTINKLKQLNVSIIQTDVILSNSYQYLNKIYAQYLIEQNYSINLDYFIYLDLDVVIKQPLPKQLFNRKTIFLCYDVLKKQDEIQKLKISGLDLLYRLSNIELLLKSKAINTNFIIHYTKNKITTKIYNLLYNANNYNDFNVFMQKYYAIKSKPNLYYYEEALYDYAYYMNIIKKDEIMIFNSSLFDLKYFIHNHINYKNFKQFINYYNNERFK